MSITSQPQKMFFSYLVRLKVIRRLPSTLCSLPLSRSTRRCTFAYDSFRTVFIKLTLYSGHFPRYSSLSGDPNALFVRSPASLSHPPPPPPPPPLNTPVQSFVHVSTFLQKDPPSPSISVPKCLLSPTFHRRAPPRREVSLSTFCVKQK